MSNELQHCCRPRTRHGLTLIELLAGLAILGSLLVAMLTARAAHARQWQTANRTLAAVHAADRLLTQWWADLQAFPRHAEGEVVDGDGLAWRTNQLSTESLDGFQATVVRLQIIDSLQRSEPVLVAVDVVIPAGGAQGDVP